MLKDEADRLNRPFFKYMRTGLPFVTLKAAVTLDGKLATATGDSKWISGEQSRKRVHQLRDQADVVLVGANTVERDDPALTTRLPGGRDATRVVVDSRLRTREDRRVYTQRSAARTIVATLEPSSHPKAKRLADSGVDVWTIREKDGRVDLKALVRRLAREGHLHVLVEGGAEIFSSFLKERLADELLLFVAPKIVGHEGLSWSGALGVAKMTRAMELPPPHIERVGDDLLLQFTLVSA